MLAGGIAHDFNNILMVIQGHAELATFEHPQPGPLQESLDQILASVDQASDLCSQMLAYSGKGSFLVEEISLDLLVQQVLPLLQSSVTRRVELDVVRESPSEPLRGDPTQIRQVVMNVVINAAEAMDPDGRYRDDHDRRPRMSRGPSRERLLQRAASRTLHLPARSRRGLRHG